MLKNVQALQSPHKIRMWLISLIDSVAKQKKHDLTHQQNC
jgi:hypothetical protein